MTKRKCYEDMSLIIRLISNLWIPRRGRAGVDWEIGIDI